MSYMELFYPAGEQSTSWIGRCSDRDSSYCHSNSYGGPYSSSAVVLHVSMCCEQCVKKVRKSLKNVDDVEEVDVDMQRQKVIVRGYVNPERVLRKVQKVKKSATYWDSSHDYANYSTGAYDYQGPYSSPYDYANYSTRGAHDFQAPISSSYDYNYSPSSSYDYGYSYPSTNEYSRHNNHHHQSSFDANRSR